MYLNWICAALGLLAGAGAVGIAALGGGSPGALQIAAAGALGLAVWLAAVAVIGIFHKRPLVEFVASLRQMHRDGDLAKRVRVGNGLAGEAARAFNELIQSFQGIVGKVIFDAQRVGEAAEQLSLHAGSVAEGSSHQRDAAESMANAIEQMTAGVNEVAVHASQTAGNAQEARELSVKGADVVTRASQEIERIALSVEQSARVISALGERSEAISGIVKVIREIADQTNLLALNAAIEAARAGEQGRGFAVVADEVRKLAERTSTATTEISGMIVAIQGETRSAIDSIEAGSEQAHAGADLARKAAASLQQINHGAQQTMEKIDAIAETISAHSREADSIVGHVREIMDMVESNSHGARETLDEAQGLGSLAANLKEISKVFKLGAAGEEAMAVHRKMPDLAQQAAKQVGRMLEQAIAAGQISETDLFDESYVPIANTRPLKYSTRFDTLTDKLLPVFQERLLETHAELVYAIGIDRNAYVPTHNKRFSQPLTGDYDRDFVGNRTKRIFDDAVGKQCGRHELPFLIQTYRRDTGEIMHDISSPVYVNGRHWGGFRIGYRA